MNKLGIVRNLINDGGSAKFARIEATVSQAMAKTGNPLRAETITKDVVYNVMLNANYGKMVNKRLEAEGKDANFVPKQNWHEKMYDGINGSIVGKRSDMECQYLMVIVDKATTEAYYVNGRLATNEEVTIIKNFKPKSSGSEGQGLEKEVIVRTIALDNINLIKCGATVLFK
tara:strand:+ start:368 stop:883 length:516 start_codon:yes stop_codon:yes gene_type:complete